MVMDFFHAGIVDHSLSLHGRTSLSPSHQVLIGKRRKDSQLSIVQQVPIRGLDIKDIPDGKGLF